MARARDDSLVYVFSSAPRAEIAKRVAIFIACVRAAWRISSASVEIGCNVYYLLYYARRIALETIDNVRRVDKSATLTTDNHIQSHSKTIRRAHTAAAFDA